MTPSIPIALTIAGSDPSGGAGVQADLKTFHQHRVYGCAAITLLTVQNTHGIQRVELVAADLVGAQVDAVITDTPPQAIKTGALGSAAIIERVATSLRELKCPLVIDPVGLSKNQQTLTATDARDVLLRELLPLATLITPNLDEAAWLTGRALDTEAAIRDAAKQLRDAGAAAVLIKGGHRVGAALDVLLVGETFHEFDAPRIETRHTHGVGCTLSAAICARLALGQSLTTAVAHAKAWLTAAIKTAPGFGEGAGPVNHFAKILP